MRRIVTVLLAGGADVREGSLVPGARHGVQLCDRLVLLLFDLLLRKFLQVAFLTLLKLVLSLDKRVNLLLLLLLGSLPLQLGETARVPMVTRTFLAQLPTIVKHVVGTTYRTGVLSP